MLAAKREISMIDINGAAVSCILSVIAFLSADANVPGIASDLLGPLGLTTALIIAIVWFVRRDTQRRRDLKELSDDYIEYLKSQANKEDK